MPGTVGERMAPVKVGSHATTEDIVFFDERDVPPLFFKQKCIRTPRKTSTNDNYFFNSSTSFSQTNGTTVHQYC